MSSISASIAVKLRLTAAVTVAVGLLSATPVHLTAQTSKAKGSAGSQVEVKQEGGKKKFVLKPPERPRVMPVTVIGEMFCVACEAKGEFNANSDCEKYGHLSSLRVAAVIDSAGKSGSYLKNRALFLLPGSVSDKMKALKPPAYVSAKGKLYTREYLLEPESFEKLESLPETPEE